MKIGPLLAHLDELETELAAELRAAAERHRGRARRLPPVPHLRRSPRTSACRRSSRSHDATTARPSGRRRVGDGSDDLLEELRTLYLRAQEVAMTWTMAAQAAKALRDRDLLTVATECQSEAETQAKWFTTRIKVGAPQALVRGMTETSAPRRRARRARAAHASSRCARSQGRSRSASSGSPRRRSSSSGLQLGWVAPDRGQTGRSLRARVHRAAAVHGVDLRFPRARRRRRDRHGPAQRHLGRHRARLLTGEPGSTSNALGLFLLVAGVAMWAPASAAARLEARPGARARNRRPALPGHRHLPAHRERPGSTRQA